MEPGRNALARVPRGLINPLSLLKQHQILHLSKTYHDFRLLFESSFVTELGDPVELPLEVTTT